MTLERRGTSPRWSRIRSAIAVIAIAVGFVLAPSPTAVHAVQAVSCTTSTASARPAAADVVVVGDSLTVGEWCFARSAAGHYGAQGLAAVVDARVGRFTSTGVLLLRSGLGPLPERIVFALGTNDLTSLRAPGAFQAHLETVVSIAGPDRLVFFVTVHSSRQPELTAAYNATMRSLAGRHPNVVVIDWASTLQNRAGILASDGVHLSTTGTRQRSAMIAAAVAVELLPPPPIVAGDTALIGAPVGLTPMQPERLVDSRRAFGATMLRVGVEQRLQITSVGGIPADATAVALNVTVTETAGPGFLAVYPCGPVPDVSTSNWPAAGWTVATSTIAPLDPGGGVCLRSIADTHVVIDVTGAFSPAGPDRFVPIVPKRVGDTRIDDIPRDGQALRFDVVGGGSVPSGARAVSVNVAVVDAVGAAHATVYPCGTELPPTSTVNVMAGVAVQSNNAIIPLGIGAICVFTSRPADVVLDVTGWFGDEGKQLQPLVPIRLVDTRQSDVVLSAGRARRPLGANESIRVAVAGVRGVPSTAAAASLNVTAVGHRIDGFVAVHPAETSWDGTSSVNTHARSVDSNGTQVALGGGGVIALSSSGGHLIVDVSAVWV